ncbi:MAG: DUF3786 domain-containing protein [Candidatus Omnitrophota bacterium]
MGYEAAFQKAWLELERLSQEQKFTARFLADTYEIDLANKKVFSLSCNAIAPEHVGILILHYLIQKLKGLPLITNDWITFNQLPGGSGYYEAFRKRAIEPIIAKFANNPGNLLFCLERLKAKKIQYGDSAIVLDVFEQVPVMVCVWGRDEEFPAEANILFDRSILEIFPTEDIVVMAGFIAKQL